MHTQSLICRRAGVAQVFSMGGWGGENTADPQIDTLLRDKLSTLHSLDEYHTHSACLRNTLHFHPVTRWMD